MAQGQGNAGWETRDVAVCKCGGRIHDIFGKRECDNFIGVVIIGVFRVEGVGDSAFGG
jgi:hypothetical protein